MGWQIRFDLHSISNTERALVLVHVEREHRWLVMEAELKNERTSRPAGSGTDLLELWVVLGEVLRDDADVVVPVLVLGLV